MPRGNYDVQEGMDVEACKQSGRDSSYRSCVHAMLIFLIVCIILLLAAWPWKNGNTDNTASNSSSADASAIKGDKITTSTTTKGPRTIPFKVKYSSTTTTTTSQTTTDFQYMRKPLYTVIPEDIDDETKTYPKEQSTPPPSLLPPDIVTDSKPIEEPEDTSDVPTDTYPEDERELPSESSDEQNIGPTSLVTLTNEVTTTEETPVDKNERDNISDLLPIENISSTEETMKVTTKVSDTDTNQDDDTSLTSTQPEVTVTPTQQEVSSTEHLSSKASMFERLVQDPANTVTPSSQIAEQVCETSQCKVLASRMLSLMNHSVDACDDFYEYSCGGLRSSPGLVADDPEKYAFDRIKEQLEKIDASSSEAHRKFKRYYKSCVAYDKEVTVQERIDTARKLLETIGVFNEIANATAKIKPVEQLEDFTTLLGRMMLLHSTPIMDITLDVDSHNEAKFALKLTPPSFKSPFGLSTRYDHCLASAAKTLDLNDYYEKYTDCKQRAVSTYVAELELALKTLGITESKESIHDVRTDAELELFGSWIDNLPKPSALRQGLIGKDFTEMTIKQLTKEYNLIDWGSLTSRLLGQSVSGSTVVQVYFKSYFDKLLIEMDVTRAKNRQNVMLAWLIHDLYEDFVLTRNTCTRDTYCLHVASELMEDMSSSLYLSSFQPAELEGMSNDAQQVFSELRSAMEPQLRDAEWLNDQSRSAVVSKLNSLTLAVDGGQSIFLDDSTLNRRMTAMDINEENYFTMSIVLLRRYRHLMYSLYDVNPNSVEATWTQFALPYYPTGVAIYALKKIVIPFGLMTWPVYEPSLPRHVLMARLGFVIAHEIAHHFDNNGMKHGELLSDGSKISFHDMTICHKDVESFDNEQRLDDGRLVKFKVSEQLTLNERLADRAAAALSLEAYDEWVRQNHDPQQLPYLGMTNDQTYFLALAQMFCSKTNILDYGVSLFENEHPPPFLRVNTVIDNSLDFANAFKCAVGVKMNPNPSNNCDVFPKLTPNFATHSTYSA